MPDDILDAAQKAINDAAAGVVTDPVSSQPEQSPAPATPPSPSTPSSIPEEPAPVPPMTASTESAPGIPLADGLSAQPAAAPVPSMPENKPAEPTHVEPTTSAAPTPPPASTPDAAPPSPEASAFVESILNSKNPGSVVPPASETVSPTPSYNAPKPKIPGKKGKKIPLAGILGAIVMLVAIGVGAIYVANPKQLADIRSQAGKNNGFSQGGKWSKQENDKCGSGCVNNASYNEAIKAVADINSGASKASVTLPDGTKTEIIVDHTDPNGVKAAQDKAMQTIKDVYRGIGEQAAGTDANGVQKPVTLNMVNVDKNPQNMALPYVPGGYTYEEIKSFYTVNGVPVDYTKPENVNKGGYAILGPDNKPTSVAGYYLSQTNGNWYPVDTSNGSSNGDGGDTTNNPTATPVAPQCKNLRITRAGTAVTPSSLLPGDDVVLHVSGDGSPTKAHFRINGTAWQDATVATQSDPPDFTLAYTVPATGVTDFVIEAEVFTDGAWR